MRVERYLPKMPKPSSVSTARIKGRTERQSTEMGFTVVITALLPAAEVLLLQRIKLDHSHLYKKTLVNQLFFEASGRGDCQSLPQDDASALGHFLWPYYFLIAVYARLIGLQVINLMERILNQTTPHSLTARPGGLWQTRPADLEQATECRWQRRASE